MYLAKEGVFDSMEKGGKTRLAKKLKLGRTIISLIINRKRTTKHLTAKAICEEVFGTSDVEKYFDKID